MTRVGRVDVVPRGCRARPATSERRWSEGVRGGGCGGAEGDDDDGGGENDGGGDDGAHHDGGGVFGGATEVITRPLQRAGMAPGDNEGDL